MAITRTAWTDDDGTGTTGTILNNAAKTTLYDELDARWSEMTITLTGTQHNLSITSGGIEADVLRCNNATDLTITGIAKPASPAKPGKRLRIVAVGAGHVALNYENANSDTANRIITPLWQTTYVVGGGSFANGFVVLWYDDVSDRWRVGPLNGGGPFHVAGTSATLWFTEWDAAANRKHWRMLASNGELLVDAVNDAGSAPDDYHVKFTRTDDRIDAMQCVQNGTPWFTLSNSAAVAALGSVSLTRGKFFITANPSSVAAGEAAGLKVSINTHEDTAQPAAGDFVAIASYIGTENGRTRIWSMTPSASVGITTAVVAACIEADMNNDTSTNADEPGGSRSMYGVWVSGQASGAGTKIGSAGLFVTSADGENWRHGLYIDRCDVGITMGATFANGLGINMAQSRQRFAEFGSTPSNPPSNTCDVYAQDNGAGKTQLVVLFPTGTAIVLATQA